MTSKNPFELLNDDDEGDSPPPVKEVRKDDKAKPAGSDKAQSAAPKNAAASGGGRAGEQKSSGGATNARGGKASEGNNSRLPKRQFERHSGTGRGRAADGQEEKRGGAGKYNWGSKAAGTMPEDEAQDKMAPKGDDDNDESASPEKKKEDEQMSLDEYLQQKKKDAAAETLEARPAEAFDMKGLKPLLKDEEGDLNFGEGAKGSKGKNKRSGRSKEVVTDLNFTTPPIVRDSPRTRGGPRGGGRGGPRGGGQGGGAGANIVLDDSSFPSLA